MRGDILINRGGVFMAEKIKVEEFPVSKIDMINIRVIVSLPWEDITKTYALSYDSRFFPRIGPEPPREDPSFYSWMTQKREIRDLIDSLAANISFALYSEISKMVEE
jgi:hypothetical protein